MSVVQLATTRPRAERTAEHYNRIRSVARVHRERRANDDSP